MFINKQRQFGKADTLFGSGGDYMQKLVLDSCVAFNVNKLHSFFSHKKSINLDEMRCFS